MKSEQKSENKILQDNDFLNFYRIFPLFLDNKVSKKNSYWSA